MFVSLLFVSLFYTNTPESSTIYTCIININSSLYEGQVRSECLTPSLNLFAVILTILSLSYLYWSTGLKGLRCTFRASCCNARLSWAQVHAFAGSFVRDRKNEGAREGVRGDRLHWRVQGSTSSPTGIGSRRRVV